LHSFDTITKCDEQTNGHTDGRKPRRWLRRAKH